MPRVALGQLRQGWDPDAVVSLLLMDVAKNTYWRTGYNWQPAGTTGGGFVYLPGNGGLLTAVAAMVAGTDNSAPIGFPAHWDAQAEGFITVYP